jgi:hypothetical protein
MFFKRT